MRWNSDRTKFELTFPNAKYWSNADHWDWATKPNDREKASFLKENILPIQESGNLNFIDVKSESPFPQFDIFYANGHTEKQMIPLIKYKGKTVAFMADLLPSVSHIPLPYVMGYDTRPLLTMDEKKVFLNRAAKEEFVLYLEHDAYNECCTVEQTEKGVKLLDKMTLNSF